MPINQKRIAQLLGISQPTVSRALAGSRRVSDELKQKVRALTVELGYVPDLSGRSLSSGRTYSLSVVVPSSEGLIVSDMHSNWITQLHRAALDREYRLRVDHLSSFRRSVLERSVDGFVVFGLSGQHGSLISPQNCPMPVVFTDCVSSLPAGVVATDNQGGVYAAVEHLISLGHRKVAFFGSAVSHGDDSLRIERYLGYVKALNKHGITADPVLNVELDHWPSEIDETFVRRRELYTAIDAGATAVISPSDNLAVGAIRMLMHRGMTIPTDVSVIGFDDTHLARAWEPPLTTVKQDIRVMSDLAIDMLIEAIETGEMPSRKVADAPLIIRGTTGKPLHRQ